MSTTNLYIFPLETEEDGKRYENYLKEFPDNPFYRQELLAPRCKEDGQLHYFILSYKGATSAIMPILLRKITVNGKDTGNLDAISPYGYSGPLFQKNITWDKIVKLFWRHVDQWYRDNKVISEFIRFNMDGNWVGYNGELEPSLRNVCGKILPEDLQWKNFKPKVRNNYRKAVKLGLRSYVYDSDITEEHISEFYTIYRDTMLRKNAASMYLYDLEYFTNFIFKNPESCSLAMVYYDNIPISTELLLLSGNNVYSFLGGTNADYFTHRPNDLLKICVINWARKRGYSKYVLGGGRFNDDSLYKYKKDFFPKDKDVLFFTGRKVIDQATYDCLVKNSGFDQIENTTNYFPLYRFLSTQ